jgi:hypothetical protein
VIGLFIAAAAGAIGADRPLHLDIANDGGVLVIKLVGESPTPWSALYELEVSGGAPAASNRSVQRGSARLQPGRPATVATVRLGSVAGKSWTAHLNVRPSNGAPYDLEWRSH